MNERFKQIDLETEANTVKTQDNKIWVNMFDGHFVLKESLNWRHPIVRSSRYLYKRVRCVMRQGDIIARRDASINGLTRLKSPKKIKNMMS